MAVAVNNSKIFVVDNNAMQLRQNAKLRHCVGVEAVEVSDQFEFDANDNPLKNADRLPDA